LTAKERPVAILAYLLTAGGATVTQCEEELKKNRRTLQRDLKLLVENGLVREIGTGPTELASKRTSFFQTINVIAAIFRAKVKRAIVGFLCDCRIRFRRRF
jgi:DeoR/GlpR family transcriptional regulator of sugar metabolism